MKPSFHRETTAPSHNHGYFAMKKTILLLSACLMLCFCVAAAGAEPVLFKTLAFSEIHYAGDLSGEEARFTLTIAADATGQCSTMLLQGDIALLPSKLPTGLELVRDHDRYLLVANRAGHYDFKLALVAKIQREEPWNRTTFTGPPATIASVVAEAAGADTEVQLLNGTLLETVKTNDSSRVTGFLGADQTVALRWQARVAEVAHTALLTVDSTFEAQITPTVIKYTGRFHYAVVQGSTTELKLRLPVDQALTHLDGQQIRDWHLAIENGHQTLTIELVKPLDSTYDLALYCEQN